jgi:hypothetical protein
MLTVVCWRWGGKYRAEHVRRLKASVARHLRIPHEFVCLTDTPDDLDGIHCLPLPYSGGYKNCRRLWIFSEDAAKLGDRLLQIDLDMVIVDDITDLVNRTEPFVVWKSDSVGAIGYALNPSFLMVDAGARADIWRNYRMDEKAAVEHAKRDCVGSDQAVMTDVLRDEDVPVWTAADGILAYRVVCGPKGGNGLMLPEGARVMSFHGPRDPSMRAFQDASPWIAEHWRC